MIQEDQCNLPMWIWILASMPVLVYRKGDTYNDPKVSDRRAWANSVDPDETEEQSDQGLHCLPFRLHFLDPLLSNKMMLFQF